MAFKDAGSSWLLLLLSALIRRDSWQDSLILWMETTEPLLCTMCLCLAMLNHLHNCRPAGYAAVRAPRHRQDAHCPSNRQDAQRQGAKGQQPSHGLERYSRQQAVACTSMQIVARSYSSCRRAGKQHHGLWQLLGLCH